MQCYEETYGKSICYGCIALYYSRIACNIKPRYDVHRPSQSN